MRLSINPATATPPGQIGCIGMGISSLANNSKGLERNSLLRCLLSEE
jgi:hypothetical protein